MPAMRRMLAALLAVLFLLMPTKTLLATNSAEDELPDAVKEDVLKGDVVPEGVVSSYKLTVDVTNQVVSAYARDEFGEYTVLVRQMICSTGLTSTPTPLGVFKMPEGKRYDWAYFPKFNVYAQYLTRIRGAYLFHSVLYNKRDENTLITSSYRNLGKRASHGCVRLLVEDARWINENCGPGTECEVFEGPKNAPLTASLKPIPLGSWYPRAAKAAPTSVRRGGEPQPVTIRTAAPEPAKSPDATPSPRPAPIATARPAPTPDIEPPWKRATPAPAPRITPIPSSK